MASEKFSYDPPPAPTGHTVKEQDIESEFIEKLCSLKYIHRSDIHDRASLEANFREKFEELNRVRLTDSEFAERFLKKCDLGRTISRYMVLLAREQKLMTMRPYQIYTVQHLVKSIDNGNGYIWHTTGSDPFFCKRCAMSCFLQGNG